MRPTAPEKFLIHRKRLGETQAQAANRMRLSVHSYRVVEQKPTGRRPPALGSLEPWEKCLLLRRRKGMTQAELAKALGLSRWWVNLMESGRVPSAALEQYWQV